MKKLYEPDRSKCPVCNGTGHAAFNPDEKCRVCEGYGVPVWSDAFKKLVEEGKISSPPKPKRKYPEFIRVALLASDFNDYQRLCRHVGMTDVYLPELRRKVKSWNLKNKNQISIPWLFSMSNLSWHPEEMAIAAEARGYRHYEILIEEYNQAHGTVLPIRTRQAVVVWRHANKARYSWNKGYSFIAERLDKDGVRTGKLLLFNGFVSFHREIGLRRSPLRRGVWLLTDAEVAGRMGTSKDFLRYTELHGRKIGKSVYLRWLKNEGSS